MTTTTKTRKQNTEVKVNRGIAECTVCRVEIGRFDGMYVCAADCGVWAPVFENIYHDKPQCIRDYRGFGYVSRMEYSVNEPQEIREVIRELPVLGPIIAYRRMFRAGSLTLRDIERGFCTQQEYDRQRENRAKADVRTGIQASSGMRRLANQRQLMMSEGI